MLAHANDTVPGRFSQRPVLQTQFLDLVRFKRPQRVAFLYIARLASRDITQRRGCVINSII